jgi:glycosyltransferase involved in cell wall biosynthesis
LKSVIVHDWLVSPIAGSEKTLREIHGLFPSPIYTLLKNEKKLEGSYFEGKELIASFIQKLPFAQKYYRNYLPFFPLAIEQFDLSAYDLILSSSHCVAKGVICHPDQLHISYCHTPIRYAWDLMHPYLNDGPLRSGVKGALARFFLQYVRNWDVLSSNRVDAYIANSKYVAGRIRKYYGRSAHVIFPPVDIESFQVCHQKENFYLAASRMVPYKRLDLIVEAFSLMPDKKLVVIGSGPEEANIKKKAHKNIEFLGFQSDSNLQLYLRKAKAFVFAAIEDFGILPVEAMASGTPVIAFRKGGAMETVQEGVSGLFFEEQSITSLQEAIRLFETLEFDSAAIRSHAEQFSRERFRREFQEFVLKKYSFFKQGCVDADCDTSRRWGNSSLAPI